MRMLLDSPGERRGGVGGISQGGVWRGQPWLGQTTQQGPGDPGGWKERGRETGRVTPVSECV